MRSFPVEDDLVAKVWELAKPAPFEQLSFSDALRRVLGADSSHQTPVASQPAKRTSTQAIDADELLAELSALPDASSSRRVRAPKADLRELVSLGFLRDGQELVFFDYKGHAQPKYRAVISGSELIYQRVRYSMSALSSLLLKKEGYIAESVRGPDHWGTTDGKRIRELWESVLKQRDTQ